MSRIVYWRGGNSYNQGGWAEDGRYGDPNSSYIATDSNWVLQDGTPTYAPEVGDTIVFDDHAKIVPYPNMSGWDEDTFNAFMNDPTSQYNFENDTYTNHGHQVGKHYDCNMFFYKYLAGNDYVYSGFWDFKELIIKPEYTGQIGLMRLWRYTVPEKGYNVFDVIKSNPLPIHFESDGGIVFLGGREHYIRCSDRREQVDLNGTSWEQDYGPMPTSKNIDRVFINSKDGDGVIVASSQFNEATKRSKWTLAEILSGKFYAQELELDKWWDDTNYGLDDGFYSSAVGTVVDTAKVYGDDGVLHIEKECVDKSNSDKAVILTAYRGKVRSQSSLGTTLNYLAQIVLGQYNIFPNMNCDIESLVVNGGSFDWWSAGTLNEAVIRGGKVRAFGGGTKKFGVDANTIDLRNGVFDVSMATGRTFFGINNCNLLKKGGQFIAQGNNKIEFILT